MICLSCIKILGLLDNLPRLAFSASVIQIVHVFWWLLEGKETPVFRVVLEWVVFSCMLLLLPLSLLLLFLLLLPLFFFLLLLLFSASQAGYPFLTESSLLI